MFVSVVIPTYNSAQFLTETIESVIAQTYDRWELIIVDGMSKDNTREIIQKYCDIDSRISTINIQGGVSFSRNQGAKIARGEIIAFLDSDDLWLPEKLSAHVNHFQKNFNLGVSFTKAEFIKTDSKSTGTISKVILKNLKPEDFLYNNPTTSMSNIAVRKKVIEQFTLDESMSYSEDIEWLFRIIYLGGYQIEGIDRILFKYRTNDRGLSSQLDKMEAGWNQFINNAKKYAPDLIEKHYSLAKAVQLRYLARRAFRLHLPTKISASLMTRALQSDWKLLLKEPRATLLTFVAVYFFNFLRF